MKVTIVFVIALIAAANCVFADNVTSWVRVYTPSTYEYRALTSDPSLDIAAARPGEYVDLIIGQNRLDAIAGDGYAFEYLMYDVNDPANYEGKGYSGYTNYTEMQSRLYELVKKYPDILKQTNVGTGRQGTHNIYLIKVSDNVDTDEQDEEKLMVTGVNHAREGLSLEVPLYFLEQLCADYATDLDVQNIVNELELYVIPLVNPEGYNYDDVENERNWWRKNSYDWPNPESPEDYGYGEGTGVDLNRNYTYMWGYDDEGSSPSPSNPLYRGPGAGSEPEIQVVMDICVDKDILSAFSFHSYSELILRPWSYINEDPDDPDDMAIFDDIGYGYQDIIQGEMGRYYDYKRGYNLYPVNGNTTDYWYGQHGIYGFCVELNSWNDGGFYPDESFIEPTTTGHYEALKWWCLYIVNGMTGIEDDENGDPNAPTAFALKPVYPNPAGGAATFAFTLPEASEVTLDVYDVKGRKVMTVLDESRDRGEYEVTADVGALSSGIYIYRLSAGNDSAAKKMIVIR
ncbi:MAG: T9SS type A sorting domain-containing protein [bacterium]|nr:T9SS type A sorting domain-containing protein [bacterium]